MNMKKRFLAFFLMLVMVMGSTAVCSAQSTNVNDALAQAQKVTSGTFSYEIHVKADAKSSDVPAEAAQYANKLNNVYVKLDGTATASGSAISVSYKASANDTYKEITDMVVDQTAVYVNIKKLAVFLKETKDPTMTAYATMLPVDKTYVKITPEELATLSGTTVDTSAYNLSPAEAAAYSQKIFTILQKSVKGVKPAVFTEKNGVYTIKVNNKNALKFLTNLKKNIDSSDLAEKTTISSELKTAITSLKKDKKTKFSLVATMELTGAEGSKTVNQTASFNYSNKTDGSMSFTMNGSITENAAATVTVPTTDFITFTDLYKALLTTK